MKMRQAGLVGVAMVALGVAGGVFLVRGRAPQKLQTPPVSEAEFSEVKNEVLRLRSQVALSNVREPARVELPSAAASPAEVQARAAAPVPETDHSPGAQPLPQQPSVQEIQETRLELFKNERVDPAWRREAEVVAQRQISAGLPAGARAGALECRSSMCRVEVAYNDVESYKEFIQKSLVNPEREWKGGVMGGIVERHDDGSIRAEHYFVRPGADPMAAVLAQYQTEHE